MNAAAALKAARNVGVRVTVDGGDLVLDAEVPPPEPILDVLRRLKPEIVALLAADADDWSAEDWQTFFDERAGIAEFDGEQTRADAEANAFECCNVEWLNHHLEASDPRRCDWCGRPDPDGHAVVPFGTESKGHTWLHPKCWNEWSRVRRERAQQALAAMGLDVPPKSVNGADFPNDFGKNGGA